MDIVSGINLILALICCYSLEFIIDNDYSRLWSVIGDYYRVLAIIVDMGENDDFMWCESDNFNKKVYMVFIWIFVSIVIRRYIMGFVWIFIRRCVMNFINALI